MEWDQIVDRWAAMTNRLRSDRIDGSQNILQPQDAVRAKPHGDGQSSDKIIPAIVGNDRSLPSNQ